MNLVCKSCLRTLCRGFSIRGCRCWILKIDNQIVKILREVLKLTWWHSSYCLICWIILNQTIFSFQWWSTVSSFIAGIDFQASIDITEIPRIAERKFSFKVRRCGEHFVGRRSIENWKVLQIFYFAYYPPPTLLFLRMIWEKIQNGFCTTHRLFPTLISWTYHLLRCVAHSLRSRRGRERQTPIENPFSINGQASVIRRNLQCNWIERFCILLGEEKRTDKAV